MNKAKYFSSRPGGDLDHIVKIDAIDPIEA